MTWFTVAVSFAWIVSIWIHRFIPMTDYPRWIHTGQIFFQLITKKAPPHYSLFYWPVPNTIFVLTIGLLDFVLLPETSGKVFLSICIALYIMGSYRLVGALTNRRDLPVFLLPLLYTFHLSIWLGELSYSMGLNTLLLAMAYLLSAGNRPKEMRMGPVAALSILIFYCHAISYLCWVIFLILLGIFDSRHFPRLKIAATLCPSLILMGLYVLHRPAASEVTPLSGGWFMATLLDMRKLGSVFAPLHFFEPFYTNDPKWVTWLAITFNFVIIGLDAVLVGIWLKAWRKRFRLKGLQPGAERAVFVAPLVLSVLFLFPPLKFILGVDDLNYRFLLPAFIFVLAGLAVNQQGRPSETGQWLRTAFAAFSVTVVLIFQLGYVGRISKKLEGIYDILGQAHLDPSFRDFPHNQFEPQIPIGPRPELFAVHEPLRYLPDYLRIEEEATGIIFPTSVVQSSLSFPRFLRSIETADQLPTQVVILGLHTPNREISESLSAHYQEVVDKQYVLILRRKAETGEGGR